MEKQLAAFALGEVSLQLGEVAVAGHVAQLDGAIAAEPDLRGQAHVSLGVLEDGEGVGAGVGELIVEGVRDQDVRREQRRAKDCVHIRLVPRLHARIAPNGHGPNGICYYSMGWKLISATILLAGSAVAALPPLGPDQPLAPPVVGLPTFRSFGAAGSVATDGHAYLVA